MYKLIGILSIILVILSSPLLADILGTDQNGNAVILRNDGTWNYIPSGTPTSAPGGAVPGGPVAGGPASGTNLILNGSFEQSTAGNNITTGIAHWTVVRENVDVVQTYWQALDGKHSIDLAGTSGSGAIQQSFSTIPGSRYQVSFFIAGNPSCDKPLKEMRVSAAGQSANFSFNTQGHSLGQMGWQKMNWSFVANATRTNLIIENIGPNRACGIALDVVSAFLGATAGGPVTAPGGSSTTVGAGGSANFDSALGKPCAPNREFVISLFHSILEREPEISGLNYWVDQLNAGRSKKWAITQIFIAQDNRGARKSNSDFVRDAYQAILGREPEPAGYSSWIANLEKNMQRDYLIQYFLNSPEYKNIMARCGTVQSGNTAGGQAVGQTGNITWDFETANTTGWVKTGTAFDHQPTRGDNPTARGRGQPSNHAGNYWIGTYENYQGLPSQAAGNIQGDGPKGTLTSRLFTIPPGSVNFLVGGGNSSNTRVEFLVSGNVVRFASGRNTETMRRVSWDLSSWAGQQGQIRLVDNSSGGWGHINADDFRFSTPPTVTGTGGVPGGGTVAAGTNLILNGSFEQSTVGNNITAGIAHWKVIRENVDVVQGYWPAVDGKRSVDLAGTTGSGAIQQTFNSIPGRRYQLSFFMAGNPSCDKPLKEMRVSAAGQSATFSFNTQGRSLTKMGWQQSGWSFTANATQTNLVFESIGPNRACGIALDAVSVVLSSAQGAGTAPIPGAVSGSPPAGGPGEIISDGLWKVAPRVAVAREWMSPAFNDSSWANATVNWPGPAPARQISNMSDTRANWIWHADDPDRVFFRRTFKLSTAPQNAKVRITADNNYYLYVNGAFVGKDKGNTVSVWNTAETYDITQNLQQGMNTIAIVAEDLGGASGLLVDLRFASAGAGSNQNTSGGVPVQLPTSGGTAIPPAGGVVAPPSGGQTLVIPATQIGLEDVDVYEYFYLNWNNANWGAVKNMSLASNSSGVPNTRRRIYIRFDHTALAGALNSNARIELALTAAGGSGEGNVEAIIYAATSPWREGNGTYHSGQMEQNAAPGTISWSNQPSFDTNRIWASQMLTSASASYSFDITDLVGAWQGGQLPNYGLMIVGANEEFKRYKYVFHSSEQQDPQWRPKIIVTGATTQAPTPPPPGFGTKTTQPPVNPVGTGKFLTCRNKDNEEKGCGPFDAHTYFFAPSNSDRIIDITWDTGSGIDCKSKLKIETQNGSGWASYGDFWVNSSISGNPTAPSTLDIDLLAGSDGIRISDHQTCNIEFSSIRFP